MATQVILIAGPTASGKSALALALACRIGGAVINADSMQVYRDLKVLTARPSEEDEARAPHLLYGHVPASEAYSAGRYATEAAAAIADARARGLVPIIVGGTGLYFKTLIDGLSPMPAIDPAIRAHWRAEAERVGPEMLHAALAASDPVMASRLRPTDPQRLTRALEVLESSGRSLAAWQATPGVPVIEPASALKLVIMPERAALIRRCDARFEGMMAAGAVDEVRALMALGLDAGLPAMRALGARPLMQLIGGEIGQAEAVAQAKAETRQYVKRQVTWLRSNMIAWSDIDAQETECVLRDVLSFIRP